MAGQTWLKAYTALGTNRKRRVIYTQPSGRCCRNNRTYKTYGTYMTYTGLVVLYSRLYNYAFQFSQGFCQWKYTHRKNRPWERAAIQLKPEPLSGSQWQICRLNGAISRSRLTAPSPR